MSVTAIDMPDDEPVVYETLVKHYRDQHRHLMRNAHSAMTRALRLGGRK